jgi:WXG100 family type VII secretion target
VPEYKINSDETASTSQALLNDFSTLQDKLAEVKGKVATLLSSGYSTPAAQQRFSPFFDEFVRSFDQMNQSLQGIGTYVKSVGEKFAEADNQVGTQLSAGTGRTEASPLSGGTGRTEASPLLAPTGPTETSPLLAPTGRTEASPLLAPTGLTEASPLAAGTGPTEASPFAAGTQRVEATPSAAPTGFTRPTAAS